MQRPRCEHRHAGLHARSVTRASLDRPNGQDPELLAAGVFETGRVLCAALCCLGVVCLCQSLLRASSQPHVRSTLQVQSLLSGSTWENSIGELGFTTKPVPLALAVSDSNWHLQGAVGARADARSAQAAQDLRHALGLLASGRRIVRGLVQMLLLAYK